MKKDIEALVAEERAEIIAKYQKVRTCLCAQGPGPQGPPLTPTLLHVHSLPWSWLGRLLVFWCLTSVLLLSRGAFVWTTCFSAQCCQPQGSGGQWAGLRLALPELVRAAQRRMGVGGSGFPHPGAGTFLPDSGERAQKGSGSPPQPLSSPLFAGKTAWSSDRSLGGCRLCPLQSHRPIWVSAVSVLVFSLCPHAPHCHAG